MFLCFSELSYPLSSDVIVFFLSIFFLVEQKRQNSVSHLSSKAPTFGNLLVCSSKLFLYFYGHFNVYNMLFLFCDTKVPQYDFGNSMPNIYPSSVLVYIYRDAYLNLFIYIERSVNIYMYIYIYTVSYTHLTLPTKRIV